MQTVILAGDRRCPVGPLSAVASTPMLPVGDRPLAAHAADAAVAAGTDELVFAVAANAGSVQSYFGGHYDGVPVTYATSDERGRPAAALHAVRDRFEGRVAVLDACSYVEPAAVASLFDPDRSVDAGGESAGEVSAGDVSAGGGSAGEVSAGGVSAGDANPKRIGRGDGGEPDPGADIGRQSGTADVVAATLPATVLDELPEDVESLSDIVASLGVDVPLVSTSDRTRPVTDPADLIEVTALALEAMPDGGDHSIPGSVTASGTVRVAETATVAPCAIPDGPVLVAGGATIDADTELRGPVVVGPNAAIGEGARVEAAVLCENVVVESNATISGGVFGPDCVVGAGSRIGSVSGFEERGTSAFASDGGRPPLRYW